LHHYSTSWISYIFSCSRGCHRFSGAERMTIMMSYITLLKALIPLLVLVSHQLNWHKST
jgi:TM2 domain-containing membrane protein YozV